MDPLIRVKALSKSYLGFSALNKIDFDLLPGEVHILFGENGAGKSTLVSMIAGINTPTSGEVFLDGQPIDFRSVKEAQDHGVFTVFQELSLIPAMTAAENMFLGNEPKKYRFIDRRKMKLESRKILERLGFNIDAKSLVSRLSRAEQQMVEIAKAVMGDVKVLILDEPTASLTEREVTRLFEFIKNLKKQGVGIIYISHRMREFDEIGDRVTVLRDGEKVETVKVGETDEKKLVELMTGREISKIYPEIECQPGEVILSVRDFNAANVKNVNFDLHKGEILGVGGLVGCGKSELWRAILGLSPIESGSVSFKGKPIQGKSTGKILKLGFHYLSPDRKNEGLDIGKTSRENLSIDLVMDRSKHDFSFVSKFAVHKLTDEISDKVELNEGYRNKLVSQLSGGNQQKVLFGKCFAHRSEIYIFDEPTVGVDMGTRVALYGLIGSIIDMGGTVVIISSDLPEVMHLSHRLMVLCHNRITAVLEKEEIEEEKVLNHFFTEVA